MEKYIVLDHTADGKFRAFGATLEEALANAALACASLMWDWTKVEKKKSYSIEVLARDLEQLLYKFLEEVLYFLDAKNFLLGGVDEVRIEKVVGGRRIPEGPPEREERSYRSSVRFEENSGVTSPSDSPFSAPAFRLTARFFGDENLDRYEIYGNVKAVTYNEMKIEHRSGRWSLQAVVDM
jgi:SHS2 domain-containing protein